MNKILKKYILLLFGAYVTVRIIALIILIIFPDILTYKHSETHTTTLSIEHLYFKTQYLVNIIFVRIIYKDFKKLNIKSYTILLTTLLTGFAGVIISVIYMYKVKSSSVDNGNIQ